MLISIVKSTILKKLYKMLKIMTNYFIDYILCCNTYLMHNFINLFYLFIEFHKINIVKRVCGFL